MPFWWQRRKKFWYGQRYRRRNRFATKRRKRRYLRRRKHRRPTRRRRRRRRKVRRKRATLIVRQWQPDSIVLCQIKGYQSLCWGAEGSQYQCSTLEMFEYTRTKYPGGGGFAAQIFTLQYLYDQWRLRNNIWTKTNEYKDLCRFLSATFSFYRHSHVDFVVFYDRQPPFDIEKETYMEFHPYIILQKKHKLIIPSLATHPKGKYKKKKKIRPPKQMLTKWFFTQQFAKYDLMLIGAAACSLRYPTLGCCNENKMLTLYCLNTEFYKEPDWLVTKQNPDYYKPYSTISKNLVFVSGSGSKKTEYDIGTWIETQPQTTTTSRYYYSIGKDTGYFSPRILKAYQTKVGAQEYKPLPLLLGRYNPAADDGKGNTVYLQSITSSTWSEPTQTPDFIIKEKPLWLAFWGYYSFLKHKYHEGIFPAHMFVVISPYIQTSQTEKPNTKWAFIDQEFLDGKYPWDTPITYTEQRLWYPTVDWQFKTINAFCESGPFVPKLSNQTYSTWELMTHYNFKFKWGGPQISEQAVEDPKTKNKYPVPDTIQQAIQIYDPTKNIAATMFHDWDYRRGCITSKAIKRMQQNLPSDSSIQSDSDTEMPAKKRRLLPVLNNPEEKAQKINKCLLSLCEESTCQEPQEEENLLQLIKQQQQHQRELKHNLLTLIKDLKIKQKHLQLQTGVLE
nr:MAG: ORF1 [Torque teno midi virus]